MSAKQRKIIRVIRAGFAGLTVAAAALAGAPLARSALPIQILFNGVNIVNATTPPSVVVGQQVVLTASVPAALGTASSQKWSIGGTAIGGYTPSAAAPQSGKTTAVVVNKSSVTFYWYLPTAGSTYKIAYSYTLTSGKRGVVNAAFTVNPAPVPNVGFYAKPSGSGCLNACDIYRTTVNGASQLVMGFGNPTLSGDPGMIIGTNTDPAGGSFQWVQLILSDDVAVTNSHGGKRSCGSSAGLDSAYPYPAEAGIDTSVIGFPATLATGDFPAIGLFAGDVAINRFFKAQTYLMWTSGIADSIPVPVGSVPWGFIEISHTTGTAPNGWAEPVIVIPPGLGQFSTQSPTYPVWRTLSTATRTGNC